MQIEDVLLIVQTCIAAASLIVSIVTLDKVTKIKVSNKESNKTSNKQVAKGKKIIQNMEK